MTYAHGTLKRGLFPANHTSASAYTVVFGLPGVASCARSGQCSSLLTVRCMVSRFRQVSRFWHIGREEACNTFLAAYIHIPYLKAIPTILPGQYYLKARS